MMSDRTRDYLNQQAASSPIVSMLCIVVIALAVIIWRIW